MNIPEIYNTIYGGEQVELIVGSLPELASLRASLGRHKAAQEKQWQQLLEEGAASTAFSLSVVTIPSTVLVSLEIEETKIREGRDWPRTVRISLTPKKEMKRFQIVSKTLDRK